MKDLYAPAYFEGHLECLGCGVPIHRGDRVHVEQVPNTFVLAKRLRVWHSACVPTRVAAAQNKEIAAIVTRWRQRLA
jgi:hypothetical protein